MGYTELNEWKNLLVSKKQLAGAFAQWAVRQSPYPVPGDLEKVLASIQEKWTYPEFHKFESMGALEALIDALIAQMPEVLAWNNRKNGREGMGFSSRYDQPAPDDDFIDLGALSRNVAMTVWAENVEHKKFDDDFDRRWAARDLKVQ